MSITFCPNLQDCFCYITQKTNTYHHNQGYNVSLFRSHHQRAMDCWRKSVWMVWSVSMYSCLPLLLRCIHTDVHMVEHNAKLAFRLFLSLLRRYKFLHLGTWQKIKKQNKTKKPSWGTVCVRRNKNCTRFIYINKFRYLLQKTNPFVYQKLHRWPILWLFRHLFKKIKPYWWQVRYVSYR